MAATVPGPWEAPGQTLTFPAATGLPAYRFVKLSSAGNATLTAAGNNAIGVTRTGTTHTTADDQYVSVVVSGVALVAASASTKITAGSYVTASSVGWAVPSTAGDFTNGVLCHGASTNATGGHLVPVLIMHVGSSDSLTGP